MTASRDPDRTDLVGDSAAAILWATGPSARTTAPTMFYVRLRLNDDPCASGSSCTLLNNGSNENLGRDAVQFDGDTDAPSTAALAASCDAGDIALHSGSTERRLAGGLGGGQLAGEQRPQPRLRPASPRCSKRLRRSSWTYVSSTCRCPCTELEGSSAPGSAPTCFIALAIRTGDDPRSRIGSSTMTSLRAAPPLQMRSRHASGPGQLQRRRPEPSARRPRSAPTPTTLGHRRRRPELTESEVNTYASDPR